MTATKAVRTASEGRICRQCSAPLPERPSSARDHHFCPGTKCRSAWHRADKQRHLDAALALLAVWDPLSNSVERLRALRGRLIEELTAAGAKS